MPFSNIPLIRILIPISLLNQNKHNIKKKYIEHHTIVPKSSGTSIWKSKLAIVNFYKKKM